jgi:hypothetical protein
LAKKNNKIRFIYTDRGYLIGLPARDMTEDEWLSYPSELTKPALTQKLYVIVREENIEDEVKDA